MTRNRRYAGWGAALACAASLSLSSVAIADEGRFEVGAFVGGEHHAGDFELGNAYYDDQTPAGGLVAGARARVRLIGNLSVELEGAYSPAVTAGSPDDERRSIAAPVVGLRAHATYDLFPWWRVAPFATLGGGTETAWFGAPDDYLVETDTDLYVHWGVGARAALGANFGLRVDARHIVGAGRSEDLASAFEATVGLYVRFGGSRSDDDQRLVAAPVTVSRALDVFDELVQPAVHREVASLVEGEGEVEHEHEHEVEVEHEHVHVHEGEGETVDVGDLQAATETLATTHYEKGSARIRRRSRRALATVAQYMLDNPHVTILITGHADGEGDDRTNLALSRKRADYAKWFIVDRGITRDRVETVGQGAEQPLGDNATPAGRAANRRIDVQLVVY